MLLLSRSNFYPIVAKNNVFVTVISQVTILTTKIIVLRADQKGDLLPPPQISLDVSNTVRLGVMMTRRDVIVRRCKTNVNNGRCITSLEFLLKLCSRR